MPKDAEEKALQELKRLEAMPPMSAEATVSRNYLDWLIAVPWTKKTRERKDLLAAEKILNEDHYGLEKVKERIVEFLAVRQLVNNPKGPILCFVGPARAWARPRSPSPSPAATNRKFVRLSLGGVRDEAEIRGHRRTYIGAFPGQIIQMMKKAGTQEPGLPARRSGQDVDGLPRRPVGGAARGARPRAEPHLHRPLPRRGVRPLVGLLHRHRQRAPHHPPGAAGPPGGDPPARLHRAREGRDREAAPDRQADQVARPRGRRTSPSPTTRCRRWSAATRARPACATWSARSPRSSARSRARSCSRARTTTTTVTPENLADYLGIPRYRTSRQEERNEIGTATGLAWTEVGRRDPAHRGHADARQGRAAAHRQAGRRDAGVGPRRDVVRALARRAARHRARTSTAGSTSTSTCPRAPSPRTAPRPASRCARPSSRRCAKMPVRRDVAMTGEITLRGKVLPIGGVKEKLLAAHRIGDHDHHPAAREREGPGRRPQERARGADGASSWSTSTRC